MLKNPELEIKTPLIEPGIVREQSNKLKKITSQVQAAHKGEDIKWWDEVINYFLPTMSYLVVFGQIQETLYVFSSNNSNYFINLGLFRCRRKS